MPRLLLIDDDEHLAAPLAAYLRRFDLQLEASVRPEAGLERELLFVGSALAVVGIISTVGLSMFPFILPSSIDPHSSLMVWNASSSHLTLWIMLVVTLIFLPIVATVATEQCQNILARKQCR